MTISTQEIKGRVETSNLTWKTLFYISSAVFAAIAIIQTSFSPYDAGESDHLVVSPAGLLRADSSLYLNDYFIRNAKMPHWTFEFFTAFASWSGQLGLLYFLYWLLTVSLAAYGNLLVARLVTKRLSYQLALIIFTTQLFGVRVMFGTSSVVLNQALPHGLAASMAFVILAKLLNGRSKFAFVLLAIIPIIHIQIGTIVVGLVVLHLLIERYRGIQISKFEAISLATGFLGIAFGFVYRPVAGNVKDFSRLCRDLAPHHCYAPSWSNNVIEGCLLITALAILGGIAIKKDLFSLSLRLIIFLLPIVALVVSLGIDRFSITGLADFVRGNNIYRIAVVVLPWLYWVSFLIFRSGRTKPITTFYVVGSLVLLVKLMTLSDHGNYFEGKILPVLGLFCVAFVILSMDERIKQPLTGWMTAILSFILVGVPVVTFTQFGYQDFSKPRIGFLDDPYFRGFGKAVRQDVLPGQVVVGNPTLSWIRVASGVAYGVDCKFRPLGGGAPLQEFYGRIDPLGGYDDACNHDSFSTVEAKTLIDYTKQSDGDLLLIPIDDARISQLENLGWKKAESKHLQDFGYILLSS